MKLSEQKNAAASFFPFLLLPQVSNAEKWKHFHFSPQEMDFVSVILASS